ncbi:inositol monophosphatase family protein [Tabrizicola sp. M-4]|uniref:inositol monophosphatase family protein n=1 Tax=Tabrizicola sp. M-4 TaxID=3055847 RepID=UPI003DAA4977
MVRSDDLARAVAAAQEAGEILLSHYQARDRLAVSNKRAGDFVSEADLAAEAHLRQRLQQEGDGWLGEETAPQDGGRRWVVDPLDGTTNFLRGIPHWCVSVGLEVAGRPVLGVVHDPLREETFAAAPGQGLRLNGEAAGVAETGDLASALFGTGIPFGGMDHIGEHAADIARLMPHCAGVRRMGAAALDLAWVASGRLDGFWERRLRPWDIAAGLALLEASGAVVEGIAPGEEPWQSGTVLTAAPAIFVPFAALIRNVA